MSRGRSKPETVLSRRLANALEAVGFEVFRLQCGMVRAKGGWFHGNRAGVPDRLVMLSRGRVAWLEAKYDDGKPTADQEAFRRRAERRGHVVITFWTVAECVQLVLAAERAAA